MSMQTGHNRNPQDGSGFIKRVRSLRLAAGSASFTRALVLPAASLSISAALLAFLPSLPAALSISTALAVIALVLSIPVFSRIAESPSALFGRLEIIMYGARRLRLDSLYEWSVKGGLPAAAHDLEKEIILSPDWSRAAGTEKNNSGRELLRALPLLAVILAAFIILLNPLSRRIGLTVRFMTEDAGVIAPKYYIKSMPLEIRIARQETLGSLYLKAANAVYAPVGSVFTVPSGLTGSDSLDLELQSRYAGLTRSIWKVKAAATDRLLLDYISYISYHPALPGRQEKSASLEDREVWAGSMLYLQGRATLPLSSVRISNAPGARTSINGTEFTAAWPAEDAGFSLYMAAENGDTFISPVFKVRERANTPPEIRLLFPPAEIRLESYPWKAGALAEAMDDAGISAFILTGTVSNTNPSLARYAYTLNLQAAAGGSRNERYSVLFSPENLELLPGDRAVLKLKARDLFGLTGNSVEFSILFPDAASRMENLEKNTRNAGRALSQAEQGLAEVEKYLESGNAAGLEQKMREYRENLSNLQELTRSLEKELNGASQNSEILETVRELRRMNELLEKDLNSLQALSRLMLDKGMPSIPQNAMKEMRSKDALNAMKGLLETVERYKPYLEALENIKDARNTLDFMRKTSDTNLFNRARNDYREILANLAESKIPGLDKMSGGLDKESANIRPSDSGSMLKSESMLSDMEKAVREAMNRNASETLDRKSAEADRVLSRLALAMGLLSETLNTDWGSRLKPLLSNTARAAEVLTAIQASHRETVLSIREILKGLTVKMGDKDLRPVMEKMFLDLDSLLAAAQVSLRDYQLPETRAAFLSISAGMARLGFLMVDLKSGLKDASKGQKNKGEGSGQQSLSMESLGRMQGLMSQSLMEALQRMAGSGGLTPEMEQLMEELSRLQESIRQGLTENMKAGGDGAVSGGAGLEREMRELQEMIDRREINENTALKSRRIEEMLLKSRKALEQKGQSESREASRPGIFEALPPDSLDNGYRGKRDWGFPEKQPGGLYYERIWNEYRKKTGGLTNAAGK